MLMHLHAGCERPNAFAFVWACTERVGDHAGRLHRVSAMCKAPWMVARVQACPNVILHHTAVLRAVTDRAHASARGV